MLGAGVQADWQPLALYRERPFARLSIWARSMPKAEALRKRLSDEMPGVEIVCGTDIEIAVRSAEVLITATQAREPLVKGQWLRKGMRVTACRCRRRHQVRTRCDGAATREKVFVDARATAEANGDVHRAIRAGRYSIDDVSGEIGEVISGHVPGRTADDDVTVAKLVGIGAQDLVAAEVALAKLGADR